MTIQLAPYLTPLQPITKERVYSLKSYSVYIDSPERLAMKPSAPKDDREPMVNRRYREPPGISLAIRIGTTEITQDQAAKRSQNMCAAASLPISS